MTSKRELHYNEEKSVLGHKWKVVIALAVTMKEISEISGVSRGTVDRVLNGRGKVSPEKEALVKSVAKQLGYKPNLAGKALAARKKLYTIGVLLASEGNPFFDEVFRGIEQAKKELADYGVSLLIHTFRGYDSELQVREMEKMRSSIHALVLNPINEPAVAEKINELWEDHIPVVTVNTDVENSRRICYVGNDYFKSGAAACGILALMLKPDAKLGILTGSVKILGHSKRIAGFHSVLKERYPGFQVMDVEETNDDDFIAFEQTKAMLTKYPDIEGLFVVAAGTYGVCRAVLSLAKEKQIAIVCVDKIPTTEEMIHTGVIRATICQQPFTQGYQSIQKAWQYLVGGQMPEDYITKSEIKILENL